MKHKNFSFPLNVYAHVLMLDYGDFHYLHYGLFEPGQSDMLAAQRHASALFLSYISAIPRKILEVGIGLGTTLNALKQAGHQVSGITPDASQVRFAKDRHGDDLPAVCTALEDFGGTQTFELMLFQESAQYINTATLFHKAQGLLDEGGEILIMDEVSLRQTGEPGLPLRDEYVAQAAAFGFELVKALDLSGLAAPTCAYILKAVTRHRAQLIEALGLPEAEIDGLLASAKLYQEKYTDGRYGYALLHFKKTSQRSAD